MPTQSRRDGRAADPRSGWPQPVARRAGGHSPRALPPGFISGRFLELVGSSYASATFRAPSVSRVRKRRSTTCGLWNAH